MPAVQEAGEEIGDDRPMRADARRNRERILSSAQVVFSEQGLSVPIDEIARHAGLGVGTVYRHFPTKEALYEAIVVRHVNAVADTARSWRGTSGPGEAFFDILRRIVAEATTKRDLTEALASAGVDVKAVAGEAFSDLRSAVASLLERAQQCGAVRCDVAVEEVFALIGGACMSSEREGAPAPGRMADLVCDALRASAGSTRPTTGPGSSAGA